MRKQEDSNQLYRIGEAAAALDLKTCVLRFWESEFPQLEPVRTPKGQRLYSENNMALLRRIRSLLHEQGMTIEGAKRVLAGELAAPADGAKSLTDGSDAPIASAQCSAAPFAPQCGGTDRAETSVGDSALLRDAVSELRHLRRLLDSAGADVSLSDDSSTSAKGSAT